MSDGVRLRVLCYNIRHAQGIGGIISTGRVARVISGVDCDVAALAEVWRVPKHFDQPSLLAELTGMVPRFHGLGRVLGRESGNALLSRLPIESVRFIDLGGRRERRGCMIVELQAGGVRFAFATTHLSLDRATRTNQIKLLATELPRDQPLVVAGDFNCGLSELEPLQALLRFPAEVPPTYPSPLPFRALDHIGFSTHWSLESLVAIRSWASDHRPLLAELTMKHD